MLIDEETALIQKDKPPEESVVLTRRDYTFILLICVAVFFQFSTLSFVVAFIPLYAQESFGFNLFQVGIYFSLHPLASFVTTPIGGLSCVYLGRVPTAILGYSIQAFGCIWTAYSYTSFSFYSARACQGAGCGLVIVSVMSILTASFKGNKLRIAFSFREISASLCFIIGPAFGAFLFEALGFFTFYVLCTIFLLLMIPIMIFFQIQAGSAEPPRALKLSDIRDNSNRLIWITLAAAFICEFNFNLIDPFTEPHLKDSLGLGPSASGSFLALAAFAYMIATIIITRWNAHSDHFNVIIGLLGVTSCYVFIGPLPFLESIFSTYTSLFAVQLLGYFVYGYFSCYILLSSYNLLSAAVPMSPIHPEVVSTLFTTQESLSAVAPSIAGVMLETFPTRPLPLCTTCFSSFSFVLAFFGAIWCLFITAWVTTRHWWPKDILETIHHHKH